MAVCVTEHTQQIPDGASRRMSLAWMMEPQPGGARSLKVKGDKGNEE